MKRYEDAIFELNPEAKWDLSNNDLSTLIWLHGTTPIDVADIEAKATEIETRDAHIEPRQRAYPSIEKQLDMQYHDAVNGTTTWKDAIAKVKADNPKAE
jgi:hypothetical protein